MQPAAEGGASFTRRGSYALFAGKSQMKYQKAPMNTECRPYLQRKYVLSRK